MCISIEGNAVIILNFKIPIGSQNNDKTLSFYGTSIILQCIQHFKMEKIILTITQIRVMHIMTWVKRVYKVCILFIIKHITLATHTWHYQFLHHRHKKSPSRMARLEWIFLAKTCTSKNTHKPLNGYFPGNPMIASCCWFFFPLIPNVCLLLGQAETFHYGLWHNPHEASSDKRHV